MTEIIISGTVRKVDAEETVVSSSFTKRELVVSTDEQYPQHILINFTQGKCNNMLDQIAVGTPVSVSVNIRGREWVNPQNETKYFNDIQGWKVAINTGTVNAAAPVAAAPPQTAQAAQAAQTAAPANNIQPGETEDDLLF